MIKKNNSTSIKNLVDKAISFYNKKEYSKSLNIYFTILKNNPDKKLRSIICYNMGLCFFAKYLYKESQKYFNEAFNLGYNSGYELCMSYLFNHNYQEGYKYYKYRPVYFLELPIKRIFNFDDIKGNLLVLNEQGFGDEILFSRIIKRIEKECHYQVYQENYNLFNDIFKYDNIKFFSDRTLSIDFINQFDCYCYSGDLFSNMIINEGIIPYDINLNNTKELTGNIGVVWKTNRKSKNTEERSINISNIEPLFYNKIVHNLQKDIIDERMINYDFKDFLDTKKVIDNLDFVYTVDTAIAHLSSLLGKKTYILYDKYLDWRWRSPYYNSFELLNISQIKHNTISHNNRNIT